eukprot:860163-Pelagomonas_calceolata.AAC.3
MHPMTALTWHSANAQRKNSLSQRQCYQWLPPLDSDDLPGWPIPYVHAIFLPYFSFVAGEMGSLYGAYMEMANPTCCSSARDVVQIPGSLQGWLGLQFCDLGRAKQWCSLAWSTNKGSACCGEQASDTFVNADGGAQRRISVVHAD